MRLGDFEIHLLVAGGWLSDGGATFGVVPKVLWERQKPADERNLIRSACLGVVVRHSGRVIVCETGIGTKLDEKRARQMGVWEPEGLLTALKRLGVRPEEVDLVTSSHLPWVPASDLDVLRTIEEKARLLEEAAAHRWLLVLGHETDQPAGYVDAEGSWTPETALTPDLPTASP